MARNNGGLCPPKHCSTKLRLQYHVIIIFSQITKKHFRVLQQNILSFCLKIENFIKIGNWGQKSKILSKIKNWVIWNDQILDHFDSWAQFRSLIKLTIFDQIFQRFFNLIERLAKNLYIIDYTSKNINKLFNFCYKNGINFLTVLFFNI